MEQEHRTQHCLPPRLLPLPLARLLKHLLHPRRHPPTDPRHLLFRLLHLYRLLPLHHPHPHLILSLLLRLSPQNAFAQQTRQTHVHPHVLFRR